MPRLSYEIGESPWLHPAAIEYFEQLLQPTWRVLEHGAGGSTLWLAKRVEAVVSVEHDLKWREQVRILAPANVTLLTLLPEPTHQMSGSPDIMPLRDYDLIFIDGERMERGRCLEQAHQYLKPEGWIVLDNANRPEYADERWELAKRAKLKARFDNNIPSSKFFVTEIWRLAKCE
jgi:predicted O-methyltransferase YrrM